MGPTASGKTALAVELVQCLPFEIISVDSALVYRGLDIGTAKPDKATRQLAPHRLIDIIDPTDSYSAGRFRMDALREIAAIQAQGKIPLLVGGTMLYFRALEQGLAKLPSADPDIRAQLAAQLAVKGSEGLHARLAQVDAVAAARIHRHDTQRIQRALEVYALTGKPLTELCAISDDEILPFRLMKLVVAPMNRQWLHQQIARRFQSMLEQGFIGEVECLRARGDLTLEHASMRTVGYRQVWQYLDGNLDYAAMVERGIIATRQLAKRQLTWLRADSELVWLDSASPHLLAQVFARLADKGFYTNAPDCL